LFVLFWSADNHPMASAAAPHYQLRLGNAAGSDFANEASIGMLSGWGDFFTLEKKYKGTVPTRAV
jgi:hypothetical protein